MADLVRGFYIFAAFYSTNMNSSGDEEDTGPSVDAVEPEERIAARRLRITRRVDAARR